MTLLFILMALLAFYGLLDAVVSIAHHWRRANGVIKRAPGVTDLTLERTLREHPSNVRRIEGRVKVK